MMAEDATPLVEALLAIIDAARAYLPPDGIARAAPAGQSCSDVNVSERTYLFLAGQRTFDGIDATLPWYDARKACGVTLPQSVAPPGSPRCRPLRMGAGRLHAGALHLAPLG